MLCGNSLDRSGHRSSAFQFMYVFIFAEDRIAKYSPKTCPIPYKYLNFLHTGEQGAVGPLQGDLITVTLPPLSLERQSSIDFFFWLSQTNILRSKHWRA